MSTTVAKLERHLFERFPAEWAEPWDRVGLGVGHPDAAVERVFVSLDPTRDAVDRAAAAGATALVTHHPFALLGLERIIGGGTGPAGVAYHAIANGISLIAEHTNLDRSPEGLRALPDLLALAPVSIVERAVQPMARVTCFVPHVAAEEVISAMAEAGAGRVGAYERCAFSAQGTGEFTPLADSRPAVGGAGSATTTEELRVEMVCPRAAVQRVVAAAGDAHPYEEPLIVTDEVAIGRGKVGLGMLCQAPQGTTAEALARLAAERFEVRPRLWGDPARPVTRVVTATGSATSLIPDVLASGAEALICGEVRYHDALSASADGLAIIECGHDVTEWPLVPVLADALRGLSGLDAESVIVDRWTASWRTI